MNQALIFCFATEAISSCEKKSSQQASIMKSVVASGMVVFCAVYLSVSTVAVYGISADQDLTLTSKELQALQEVF